MRENVSSPDVQQHLVQELPPKKANIVLQPRRKHGARKHTASGCFRVKAKRQQKFIKVNNIDAMEIDAHNTPTKRDYTNHKRKVKR